MKEYKFIQKIIKGYQNLLDNYRRFQKNIKYFKGLKEEIITSQDFQNVLKISKKLHNYKNI